MKKLLLFLLLIFSFTLSGCDMINGTDDNPFEDEKEPDEKGYQLFDCDGESDFIVVDGACIPLKDVVSEHIRITGEETEVRHMNGIELMGDFVADLTGSKGLAVVARDTFEQSMETELKLSGEETDETENIIVKLNDEGFFEEVSFADDNGFSVDVTANPLALEVFGEFTVVIFEVDMGYNDPNQEFTNKLYDSLYAGGIYLIHNETGKLFATKEVTFEENTYTYMEDHSRTVTLTVTLNEPVVEYYEEKAFDENGNQLFDENGEPIIEVFENPLLDSDGNPVIFTEGPIKTEFIETPVVEYFEVERLDDDGNPVLDDDGNPIIDIIEEPVLDEEGNPKVDVQEVPMMDEEGNFVYVEEFEVEFFIEDQIEITVVEYNAVITDNPLSQVAQRFVDKIISEYYNWNYYRVNDYRIEHHGFASNNNGIFYIDWSNGNNDGTAHNQVLKKVSFDDEFNEITIQDFLDVTKAGFDQCEMIIDPNENLIICNQWDSNIKLYSETLGLINVPDSENLQPITFPNGELYFFDQMDTYVEELGYNTTALYTILDDGTLEAHYMELGERNDVCYGECLYSIQVNMLDADGEQYSDYSYADIVIGFGEATIREADLSLLTLGEFDSSRKSCDDANGCWYDTIYELLDENDNVKMKVYQNMMVNDGDPLPNFVERYRLDDSADIEYQRDWVQVEKTCDNEIGCTNNMNFIDQSFNQNGLWLWDSALIEMGDTFIQEFVLPENNTATYEYEKVVTGNICEFETCTEWVSVFILDETGKQLGHNGMNVEVLNGELIPLRVEYQISTDTTVVYSTDICTQTFGCSTYHQSGDLYFDVFYNQGDVMYHEITFSENDKTVITEETLVKEVCTNVDGCGEGDVVYNIVNDDGEVLYQFVSYVHSEYGYKAPFEVTVNISELEIRYQTDGIEQDAVCHNDTCTSYPQVYLGDVEIGWTEMHVSQGEKLINRVTISETAHIESVTEQICTDMNGCILNTQNYIIVDENGNEFQNHDNEWRNWLPVQFEYGETIPNSDQFEATFVMTNIQYNKQRINVYDFIHNVQNVVILADNLYLIESQSWMQGDDNFILTFNEETGRYQVKYTNMHAVLEITEFNEGYIAINDDETAIIEFTYNQEMSTVDYYHFDVTNLTEGLLINGVNDLIVDYDGSIYFKGVDNFIQDITGSINELGEVTIDTEYIEHEVIRVRPIN